MLATRHANLKLRPDHLDRQAFIYIRQSTMMQVRETPAALAGNTTLWLALLI